MQYAAA
jgi:casein kinase II subunit beta